MKSPLLLLLILLVFVSKQAYAQTQGAYAIGVKQYFDPFSDCSSSNPKPLFGYAHIGLLDSLATEPFLEVKITDPDSLKKELYFDNNFFLQNTVFVTEQNGKKKVDRISVKTRTEFMPHDTNINEEFELKIKQGTIRKAYSASDPCSNNFNLSGNREGYTMTTTIFIDDPVDLSAALPTRYSAASGVLTLKTNKFYKSEKNEFELQVTLQSDDQWANPRTIKGVSFSPGRDINLTYEKIAGAKSDKDTKYFEWLGRGLNFRVVKKLGNDGYTWGKPVSNVIFFPDGIQFNIHHTRRTACSEESTVVMYVTLDNSDDEKILDGNDNVRWKMRVKTTPHEDDQASSFYRCTFEPEGDKYKITATLLGGSENDGGILKEEQSDLLYGELMLEEINKNKDHCKRIFVIPPKPNRVNLSQLIGKEVVGKDTFDLLVAEDPYASLRIIDTYIDAEKRLPYTIMNGKTELGKITQLLDNLENDVDEEKYTASFEADIKKSDGQWAAYLRTHYNDWFNTLKNGVEYKNGVPTMSYDKFDLSRNTNKLLFASEDQKNVFFGSVKSNGSPDKIYKVSFSYKSEDLKPSIPFFQYTYTSPRSLYILYKPNATLYVEVDSKNK
ncbi:MAG TPA: hypothetical protein GX707_14060, partial [Epulopiscium sp.]|nr:hypothetical protein [Candidatus Epulonipiscium sp.]